MSKLRILRVGLLPRVILAIILGVALGNVLTAGWVRVFVTFNALFSQFLGFMIANLTYQLTKEYKHGVLWLFSAVLGLVIVLAAQLIVERIFLLTIPISVFIEGIGGVLYLVLLVKGEKPGAA